MFSLLFGGRLGEFVAPRLITHKELWALIKVSIFSSVYRKFFLANNTFCVFLQGGLADRALIELRKNTVDVNEIESSSGMALLHLTCAQGAMVGAPAYVHKMFRHPHMAYLLLPCHV
jgi:hypothetical protein